MGLRPIAIALALLTLVLSIGLLIAAGPLEASAWIRWGLCAGVSVVALIFWFRVVDEEWVRNAADVYADRLLEAAPRIKTAA